MGPLTESDKIVERYRHRDAGVDARRYSPLEWSSLYSNQERQRAVVRVLKRVFGGEMGALSLLDVGCGTGQNLLEFIRLGFAPENLIGVDLLEDRVALARRRLPAGVRLMAGDAIDLAHADHLPGSVDIAYFGVVFSSVLDASAQEALASTIWSLVRPGGGVFVYDFAFDNPANPDVRKVTKRTVRRLFPAVRIDTQWITLAPPLARRVVALHPGWYTIFNSIPLLRTHRLHWVQKGR